MTAVEASKFTGVSHRASKQRAQIPLSSERSMMRLKSPWVRVLAIALGILPTHFQPARAANTVPSRLSTWPTREVPFTICEAVIGDLPHLETETKLKQRGCKSYRLLSSEMARRIRSTVEDWNREFQDHVRFVERDTRAGATELVVFAEGEGCESRALGYNPGLDAHTIWLSSGCGTHRIMHEMMHVLGFHHEQKRGDRNKYIKVEPAPPTKDSKKRLEQKKWAYQYDTDGYCRGDYDFISVMHYDITRNDTEGVFPRVSLTPAGNARLKELGMTEADVGQRFMLSDGDVEAIKFLYPSSRLVDRTTPVCPEPQRPAFRR